MPHDPAAQVAAALARAGQARPQAPQWAVLERRLTSQPLSSRPSQSPKPTLHAVRHPLAAHDTVALAPARQALPQAPQCDALTCVLISQPLVASPSQSPKPPAHDWPQAPRLHVRVVLLRDGQAVPHAPQWSTSVAVSTQLPPQRTCPPVHPLAHTGEAPGGAWHTGVAPPHAPPQRPQLVLLSREVSQPLRALPSQSPKPGLQARPHTPLAQVGEPLASAGHARPHMAQLPADARTLTSQPLPALPSQSAKPVAQVSPQRPIAHVAVALGPAAQAFAHAPQCATSVCGSTQRPAHSMGVAPPQLDTQLRAPSDAVWQRLRGASQRVVHEPQEVAAPRLASQPLPALPSQSAKPAAQVPAQVPCSHLMDWFTPARHAAPHAPQFAASRLVSTSQPLRRSPSQSAVAPVQRSAQAPSTQVVWGLMTWQS